MTLNKKLGLIAGVVTIMACAVWGGILYIAMQAPVDLVTTDKTSTTETSTTVVTDQNQPSDELVARRIDGVLVPTDQANLWPLGIMIENAAFGGVRPQSGLSFAQVVYEVPVEAGITRFIAFFSGDLPDALGPVRSARPTFLEFNSEYDGLFAHAGGSPEAMQAVDGLSVRDLSALGAEAKYFYRNSTLVAPHNLFTSGTLLTQARQDKGLAQSLPIYESWLFKDDTPVAQPSLAPLSIDFGSGPLYAVDYTYNPTTNSYDRKNGGDPQTDAITGQVISPKVVIVQMVPPGVLTGTEGRINYAVTGNGTAYIAQDGAVIAGQWSKTDRQSRTIYRDATGNKLSLNRGAIWISIVPTTGKVILPNIGTN
ncbi:MAG: DUF3048 domain-containing protein [Patescibacteria group bacterium]